MLLSNPCFQENNQRFITETLLEKNYPLLVIQKNKKTCKVSLSKLNNADIKTYVKLLYDACYENETALKTK